MIDYGRSILALTGSLLKHYGLSGHGSLEELDKLLARRPRHVELVVLDGFGMQALRKLPEDSFFRRHLAAPISSVFPPTTTAAMTTLESGLSPAEHGWLGWDQYFPELPYDAVTLFINEVMDTHQPLGEDSIAHRLLPYERIDQKLQAVGVDARFFSPFEGERVTSLQHLAESLRKRSELPGFSFAYWTEPDYSFHHFGAASAEGMAHVLEAQAALEAAFRSSDDHLLIVSADHGLVDAETIYLEDYPDVVSLLERAPSLEARELSLFVKPGRQAEFQRLFTHYFPDYRLFSHEAVFSAALYGPGVVNRRAHQAVGNFLAVAAGKRCLVRSRAIDKHFAAVHAGMTDDEFAVPLILVDYARKW